MYENEQDELSKSEGYTNTVVDYIKVSLTHYLNFPVCQTCEQVITAETFW